MRGTTQSTSEGDFAPRDVDVHVCHQCLNAILSHCARLSRSTAPGVEDVFS